MLMLGAWIEANVKIFGAKMKERDGFYLVNNVIPVQNANFGYFFYQHESSFQYTLLLDFANYAIE